MQLLIVQFPPPFPSEFRYLEVFTYRDEGARQICRADHERWTAQPLAVRVHGHEVREHDDEGETEFDAEPLPRVQVCWQMWHSSAQITHVAGVCHPATQRYLHSQKFAKNEIQSNPVITTSAHS